MRPKMVLWVCPSGHFNGPESKSCIECGHNRIERHAQVHSSERAVVYLNPATGERRTPARADLPMPSVYASQGFERHEILRMTDWEKESGTVHEPTNFNPGNEPADSEYGMLSVDPATKNKLVRDIADAFASGPFTIDNIPVDKLV